MSFIKRIISTIILVLSLQVVYGQQEPLYSQYYNNFSLLNPAYVGTHDFFTVTSSVRSQWVNEPGSPRTGSLALHGGIGNNLGMGLSAIFDKVYVLNETHLYADISYAIQLSDKTTLSFGLKGGGSFVNVDLQSLGITNDPLFSQNINKFMPNIGTGAFLYTDELYISLSALNLLENKHYNRGNGMVTSATDNMIFYLSSGYNFAVNDKLSLKPSFLLRYANGVPLSTDISLGILLNKQIEFGVSHRLDDSVAGLFQIRVKDNIRLGYSYESYLSNASPYNSGSHEISIAFDLGKTEAKRNKRKPPFYWDGN